MFFEDKVINSDFIISYMENLEKFEGRYTELKCINFSADRTQREGNFSIIFKAYDNIDKEYIIIKFYDPSAGDLYRENCFIREESILKELLDKKRCIQIKSFLKTYDINLEHSGFPLNITLKYFTTEFAPISVMDSFYKNSDEISFIDKIEVYKEIVLAVQAIHKHEISHRDLKPDNFRAYNDSIKKFVVAIDFGTAVLSKCKNVKGSYLSAVGHQSYSSPETRCGLAGDRRLSFKTDYYSLGCMLYELFNEDLFLVTLQRLNKDYDTFLTLGFNELFKKEDKKQHWENFVDKIGNVIKYPDFDTNENIPNVVKPTLNKVLKGLVHFDYRIRNCSFEIVLMYINNIKTILKNEEIDKSKKKLNELHKANRSKRIQEIADKYNTVGVR